MKTPNFTNARTRKTLKNALGMTLGCLSADKPRPLGTRFIDKYYTNPTKVTGAWLRYILLETHDNHWNSETGKCKTYTYKPEGVRLIKEILAERKPYNTHSNLSYMHQIETENRRIAVEWCNKAYDFESVEYEDKSNRLWHPIQNIRKDIRECYLREQGLPLQYDIVCAAPNLLHQLSWRHSLGHVLEYIDDYTNNREKIRAMLAHETGLPIENIKILINSLFAGARFGANKHCATYKYVNNDKSIIEYLNCHTWFSGLRGDIKQMWEYLRPELPVTKRLLSNGKWRNEQMTPKNKWNLYFLLERRVLNEIKSYLELPDVSVRYFLIHDAFVSEPLPYGIDDLQMWIKGGCGYSIEFDKKIIS